jgi:ParB family transcriptional regulator, chromosome partitioning protein
VNKERRLGRGLEALLGRAAPPPETPAEHLPEHSAGTGGYDAFAAGPPPLAPEQGAEDSWHGAGAAANDGQPAEASQPGPATVEVHLIDGNPNQPRQDFDPEETRALAESINSHGLLQPVVVRRTEDGRFQLVAGERRLRAAREAGWTHVPANIIEADDRQMAELAIIENLQRKDLNALEKAASFQRYLDQYGCTQEELAARLNLDRSTIANLIRLLELPEPVQDAVRRGRITQGHARALLPLGEEHEQVAFCERVEREGLNVRQTESLVQETIRAAEERNFGVVGGNGVSGAGAGGRAPRVRSEHVLALEQELRSALGMKVKITTNARGRGKLTVHFHNHEEFERLRSQLTDTGRPELHVHTG